jgi:hypothetical protein
LIKDKINKLGNYNLENKMKSELKEIQSLDLLKSDSYTNKKKELTMEIKKFLGFRIVRTKKEKFQNVLNHY